MHCIYSSYFFFLSFVFFHLSRFAYFLCIIVLSLIFWVFFFFQYQTNTCGMDWCYYYFSINSVGNKAKINCNQLLNFFFLKFFISILLHLGHRQNNYFFRWRICFDEKEKKIFFSLSRRKHANILFSLSNLDKCSFPDNQRKKKEKKKFYILTM